MKKSPLCIVTIIYIIGICIGLYLELSMAFFILLVMLLVIQFGIIYSKNKRITKRIVWLNFIGIGILMFAIAYVKYIDYNYEDFSQTIPKEEKVEINAVVISDLQEKEYKDVYEIKLISINKNEKYKGVKCLLHVKNNKQRKISPLNYGELVNIIGKIELPTEARNYKGFDYKKYLKTKKIYASVYTSEPITIQNTNKNGSISQAIYKAQTSIKQHIRKMLSKDTADLAIGILIGDRQNIKEEINQDFRDSNLTHMLAVSGAHISYIILGLSKLLSRTGKRISKKVTILFLLFFMGLTKFTPSVTRASIMAILILIAGLLHKKANIFQNLALSSIVILIINPYSILDIGFQLSYAGTMGIVLLDSKITEYINKRILKQRDNSILAKIKKYLIESIVVTVSANIFIIPIMAYQFNTISLTFWISNLIASPLMGGIVILGLITYFISLLSTFLAQISAIPLEILLHILMKVAKICSELPFSVILIKTPYIMSIILYYALLYIIMNYKIINNKRTYKAIICICLITLIGNQLFFYTTNQLKIYFIDVGQGDCTLIITPKNKKILIDGGGSETGNFDVGESILLPYLLDRRIKVLDYVLISHFDSDHVGGILTILEKLEVKNIILSKQGKNSENYSKFKNIVKKKKTKIIFVQQGDTIPIDKETYISILFPEENLLHDNILNNNSIVAKLCYYNFSILFTGDIEAIAEKQILKRYENTPTLKSTILKVAHHGSKSSSIREMIDAVQPKIALIGVGEKNTFGHPNNGVLERLENVNCKIYRTDKMGEITLEVNRNGKVKTNIKIKGKT